MKLSMFFLVFTLSWNINVYAQDGNGASSEELQQWIAKEKESTRAHTNDRILVVIVKVKNDAKQEFESWIEDVLYSALYNSTSEMKKAQLKDTRWLVPVSPNSDSTWTYSWIMDPIIPKTNYDIPRFLNNEYGEEMGKKHWEKYMTFMAEPPQTLYLRQTDY